MCVQKEDEARERARILQQQEEEKLRHAEEVKAAGGCRGYILYIGLDGFIGALEGCRRMDMHLSL